MQGNLPKVGNTFAGCLQYKLHANCNPPNALTWTLQPILFEQAFDLFCVCSVNRTQVFFTNEKIAKGMKCNLQFPWPLSLSFVVCESSCAQTGWDNIWWLPLFRYPLPQICLLWDRMVNQLKGYAQSLPASPPATQPKIKQEDKQELIKHGPGNQTVGNIKADLSLLDVHCRHLRLFQILELLFTSLLQSHSGHLEQFLHQTFTDYIECPTRKCTPIPGGPQRRGCTKLLEVEVLRSWFPRV